MREHISRDVSRVSVLRFPILGIHCPENVGPPTKHLTHAPRPSTAGCPHEPRLHFEYALDSRGAVVHFCLDCSTGQEWEFLRMMHRVILNVVPLRLRSSDNIGKREYVFSNDEERCSDSFRVEHIEQA